MAEKSKRRKNRRKRYEEVDRIKRMSMFGLRIETRDDFDANSYEDFKSIRREIKDKSHSYRIGPAPVTDYDVRPNHYLANYPGSLDADLDDNTIEKTLQNECYGKNTSKAGCRGLIMYFSKLGYLDDENVDLEFIDSLLRGGADINFPDRHGQTCLHEIARGWHTDVAQFALSRGADIDKGDNYGRTPLHLAAAVNYPEMVFWLISNGAKIDTRTNGEQQTPTHYAAKNNAEDSLKVLLHMGSNVNDLDYKDRTPLYLAAETGRAEACRFLLELGAPSGVYDDAGTSALSLMVEKMPDVAKIALGQFEMVDKALRKKYYYLNYLESDIWKKKNATKDALKMRTSHARTPLEAICAYNETELIMHSVILRLIAVKWQLFGKYYTAINTGINLMYTILWTIIGVTMPKTEIKYYYTPLSRNAWRIVLELIGVTLTIYFILMQVLDFRRNERHTRQHKDWKTKEIERDMQFCHERWPEERRFLNSEVKMIGRASPSYFKNGWNVFEMCTSVVMAFIVFTRIGASASSSEVMDRIHYKSFPLLLIMLWLRFMRSCQCYQSLGPFITMLGHVITDTMKFGFLFFEFFIPYVCAFWILFGGAPETEFEKFNDVVYQVFLMTLVDEYERAGIMEQDKVLGQILVGSYLAIASVVCVNLYIALMSQTFTRIYQNAKATAFMQQAKHLLKIESTLGRKQKDRIKKFMTEACSPLVIYDTGISNESNDDDNNKLMMYRILSSVTEIKDKVLVLMMNSGTNEKSQDEPETSLKDVSLQVETVKKQCDALQSELEDIKELLSETKESISSVVAADHTQLANMAEIKEIIHQILPLEGMENPSSEANVDDLIDKVVGVISQSFMKTDERVKKSSQQSDYTKHQTPYDTYDAPPVYPKFDDEMEYRSYSSDSFSSSYVTPQRPADHFVYSRAERSVAKEFEEFQKFKRSRERAVLTYETHNRGHKMSSPKPYVHRQSQKRGHRSRYVGVNYDTDDGIMRLNRSRTLNVDGSSSLPRQNKLYRSQSAFDYYDDGSDNRETFEVNPKYSSRQAVDLSTSNRQSRSRSNVTHPPKIQRNEEVGIKDSASWKEDENVTSDQRDETSSYTLPGSERHPPIDDDTIQTIQKEIAESVTSDRTIDNNDPDEKMVESILARKGNHSSCSDEDTDPAAMGNVKSLLKQYGITLPGCNKLERRNSPMDLDTTELKLRISASLRSEKNNTEKSSVENVMSNEEEPNGQIVVTGNASEMESDKEFEENSPLIELQEEKLNFSSRRRSGSRRSKYNNLKDTCL